MTQIVFLSFIMSLLWMSLSGRFAVETFIVGYIFGFGVLLAVFLNTTFDRSERPMRITRIPDQILAFMIYILGLSRDVVLSGLDVGRRILVLGNDLPIDPSVERVYTQDESENVFVAALSAHAITITPDELVIDFEMDEEGRTVMLVHTLDKNVSTPEKLERDQTRRLALIRRILGL